VYSNLLNTFPNVFLAILHSVLAMIYSFHLKHFYMIRGLFAKLVDSPFTPSMNFVEVRRRSLFQSNSLERDALLTTIQPPLKNELRTVDHFEISCLRATISWSEKTRNRMGASLNISAYIFPMLNCLMVSLSIFNSCAITLMLKR
jgi:hypothetical protein